MSEWIKRSDRLPDKEGYYLCVWRGYDYEEPTMDVLNFNGTAFVYELVFGHKGVKVTHWMPTPPMPKE